MERKQFLNHTQGTDQCVAFATATVIKYRTGEKINADYLYKKARKGLPIDFSGLNLNSIRRALIPYYDFKRIPTKGKPTLNELKSYIDKGIPLVISVKIQEIDPTQNKGNHAVVLYKIEGDILYYINSWEKKWGPFNDNSGYLRFRDGIINWAYDIIPNKNKTK